MAWGREQGAMGKGQNCLLLISVYLCAISVQLCDSSFTYLALTKVSLSLNVLWLNGMNYKRLNLKIKHIE